MNGRYKPARQDIFMVCPTTIFRLDIPTKREKLTHCGRVQTEVRSKPAQAAEVEKEQLILRTPARGLHYSENEGVDDAWRSEWNHETIDGSHETDYNVFVSNTNTLKGSR